MAEKEYGQRGLRSPSSNFIRAPRVRFVVAVTAESLQVIPRIPELWTVRDSLLVVNQDSRHGITALKMMFAKALTVQVHPPQLLPITCISALSAVLASRFTLPALCFHM